MNTNPARLEQLTQAMKTAGLDGLIIPPSGDMHYFIGFNPGGCERFQALFVTTRGVFCVTNELYREDMATALPENTPVYAWHDSGDFHSAIQRGFNEHGLTQSLIGINEAVRGVDLMALQTLFPGCRFTDAAPVLSGCRIIKTPEEIRQMKTAGRHADGAVEAVKAFIRPGITERDIKNRIIEYFAHHNLMPAFTPIVASGVNNSRPHYNRGDRTLTPRDVIIIDLGCIVDGYCSDTSRTLFLSQPNEREKEIYKIVKQAFEAAARRARQGVAAGDVDKAAREVITCAGFGEYFINRTGHGIGTDVHEAPYIRGGSTRVLAPGMAFSIEPGIYIPGEVGMRIEDIFIINESGEAESLNHSSRELTVIQPSP